MADGRNPATRPPGAGGRGKDARRLRRSANTTGPTAGSGGARGIRRRDPAMHACRRHAHCPCHARLIPFVRVHTLLKRRRPTPPRQWRHGQPAGDTAVRMRVRVRVCERVRERVRGFF
jgi:hypothetical protein